MIEAQIKADIKAAEKALGALKKQVPYAAYLAQKNTAYAVRKTEINHMKQVFKTTSRYTLTAVTVGHQSYSQYKTSTKKAISIDLIGQYFGKAGNRKRDRHYLWDHIHGQRTQTGMERLLQNAGILPRGWFAIKTKYLDLFTKGKPVSKGIFTKIISQLKAFDVGRGYNANATDSKRSKRKQDEQSFFIKKLKNGTPAIWMRTNASSVAKRGKGKKITGSYIVPVFIFVKSAKYKKIFKFYEVAERAAPIHWRREFPKAIRHALRTAR